MQIVENSTLKLMKLLKLIQNLLTKCFNLTQQKMLKKYISDAQHMHAKVLRHPWIQMTPQYFNTLQVQWASRAQQFTTPAPGQPVQPALPVFQPGNCAAPRSQPPLSLCTLGVHTSTDVHDLTHGETADKAQTQCLGSLQYRLYYKYGGIYIHTIYIV